MKQSHTPFLHSLLLTSTLLLAACGGGDDSSTSPVADTNVTNGVDTNVISSDLTLNDEGTILTYQNSTFATQAELSSTDLKVITNHIYQYFQDEYDFIFIVSDNDVLPSGVGYYGRFYGVSNDISGIGMNIYDYSGGYGSAGKLKGVMHFPYRGGIESGPTLHELAHNWGNFILDTGLPSHWNSTGFSSRGQLGGYDNNSFAVESGDIVNGGTFSADSFGTFANGGNGLAYNDVELYLMGMISKDEVGTVQVATNPADTTGAEWTKRYFTADKIETKTFTQLLADASVADRVPTSATSQKSFRILTVLANNLTSEQNDIDEMNQTISRFSLPGPDSSSLYNFYEATGGRATLQADIIEQTLK